MTRTLLLALLIARRSIRSYWPEALVIVCIALLLSACGGHGQDNQQGTSVVVQEHVQKEEAK